MVRPLSCSLSVIFFPLQIEPADRSIRTLSFNCASGIVFLNRGQEIGGAKRGSRTSLFLWRLVAVSRQMKLDLALNNFLESDPRGLMFRGIDIDAWPRSTLKLFAAFGGQNDQTVFGIDLLRLRLFCCVDSFFASFSHEMFLLTSELSQI